jgi:hypothetical protein
MKATSFFTNGKIYFHETSHEYLNATKTWFFKTPERALDRAYNAALTIKSIEDEYFQGSKILTDSTDSSNYLMSFVKADFSRELTIAKVRLAEFKTSCLVLGVPTSAYLDKLSFLDGVLAKYVSQPNKSPTLAALPPVEKVESSQVKSQVESQSAATEIAVFDVKTDVPIERGLLNTIEGAIGKVKQELGCNVEPAVAQKMQNPKIRIGALMTSTAIKYTVLLVLLPLLYQQLSKNFFQPAGTANLQQELEYRSQKPD